MSSPKIIKYLWIGYISFIGLIIILFLFISLGWLGYMPSFEEIENPKSNLASEIISADQVVLGTYYFENRSNSTYDELPPHLVNALVSTEDVRFYKHSGVDVKALSRSMIGLATLHPKGGGSTLTQQLAKLFFHKSAKNIFARSFQKLNEWVIATKLESRYTKEEIITLYLNKFDFLNNAVGIKTAARVYFNTSTDKLTIQQSATLVGMVKNPALFNPLRRPELTLKRRNVVLNQMFRYKFITENEFDSLKKLPLGLYYQKVDESYGLATYFREYLREYLHEWCKKHQKPDGSNYNLYKDGLKIYTTINSKLQQYAEEAVNEYIGKTLQPLFFKEWKGKKNAPFLRLSKQEIDQLMDDAMRRSDRYKHLKELDLSEAEIKQIFNTPTEMTIFSWKGDIDTTMSPMDSIRYHKFFLQSGLMSMEPQTGFIRAYVGGIDHRFFKYDHVIVSKRQVGSTFKPIVYSLAMQEGESPCTEYPNIPITFQMPGQPDWTPKNADDAREGEMISLKWALANSVNYISARLIKKYSPSAVIKMARKLGITSPIDTVPSICLGTPDISVFEMTGAFSTFANKGMYIQPIFITRIEDKNGNVLQQFVPERHEAMNEETAYLMTSLMKGVVEFGTGARMWQYDLKIPVAGKTGTTQNQSDGWFIGLTSELVTGVWVGCEDRSAHFRSIVQGQGANTGLPIWATYMKKVIDDKKLGISFTDFERPANLSVETDCKKYKKEKRKPEDLLEGGGF